MNLMNISPNYNFLVAEAAYLNKQLLLLQIEALENEIIPCQKQIELSLANLKLNNSNDCNFILAELAAKVALLRSLKQELRQTDKLADIANSLPIIANSDC